MLALHIIHFFEHSRLVPVEHEGCDDQILHCPQILGWSFPSPRWLSYQTLKDPSLLTTLGLTPTL